MNNCLMRNSHIPMITIIALIFSGLALFSAVAGYDNETATDKTLSPYFIVNSDNVTDRLPLKSITAIFRKTQFAPPGGNGGNITILVRATR